MVVVRNIVVKYMETLLTVACFSIACMAAPVMAEFKGVAHAGYEFGGDNVLEVYYTDGSNSTINAGDGLVFAGGVAYVVNPEVAIQATLGWKYQTIQRATNADAHFNRFPVETILQYTPGKVRLGAGITYHINPKLHASGDLAPAEVAFDDALGAVYQLDYITEMGLMWGIRYTDLSYTVNNTDYDVDATSFGIHVTGQL